MSQLSASNAGTPYLTLIIPAYNEEERIGGTLEKVLAFLRLQPYTWELIVVDDGSQDRTAEIVSSFAPSVVLYRLTANRGKGAAVRTGMLLAQGQYRAFTDADLSTPIEELGKMLAAFERGADVVIGSRRVDRKLVRKRQPWYREMIGVAGNLLVQLVLVRGYQDTQCGFKGCTAPAAIEIFSRAIIDGFAFDIEMIYLATRLGFRIEQIGVEWYNDERSRVRAVRDTMRTLAEVFTIRRYHNRT
ncbi:MAG: glycosyl transferase [Candidatus Kapaibacterium sp.]|nr:MAG: glycosyl transferase [Candidatus Kapabacteria bacterium]